MKRPALWLALVLLSIALSLLGYRVLGMDYPLFPTAPGATWHLTIQAKMQSEAGEVQVKLGLPSEFSGWIITEERIISGALHFNLLRQEPNRVGVWTGSAEPQTEEIEDITYQAMLILRTRSSPKTLRPDSKVFISALSSEDQALASRLAEPWRRLAPSARLQAVASAARGEWGDPPPNEKDLATWSALQNRYGRAQALLALLSAAGLPARSHEGIRLTEEIQFAPLSWIEVLAGSRKEILVVESGEIAKKPGSFLSLAANGAPAIGISGGKLLEIRYSLHRQVTSQWRLHFERIQRSDRFLDRWSLLRLPPEFQQTFRILLLVPIGSLLIGFLRNMVGFPTFGIFMPVLMALAFRSTGLWYGLAIYAGVLLIGYGIRWVLDKLRLLLVLRMSVLLTVVIACFTLLALVGARFGIREFMAVGLLPFVILTMIIERFFVVVEEAGIREGMKMAAGSAVVAVITYKIISWEPLQLTFFIYPELLLAVAAVLILLGRYTGFRLSELIRFRSFGSSS